MTSTQKNDGQKVRLWRKPCEGWFKCNTDAAVFEHKGYIGYGSMVRDDNGKMVTAKNELFWGVFNPALIEAISCKEALS